jgi:hypothetical protein
MSSELRAFFVDCPAFFLARPAVRIVARTLFPHCVADTPEPQIRPDLLRTHLRNSFNSNYFCCADKSQFVINNIIN